MPKLTNLHKTDIAQHVSVPCLRKEAKLCKFLDFCGPTDEYSHCANHCT